MNNTFLKMILKFLKASKLILPNKLMPFYINFLGDVIFCIDRNGRRKVIRNLSMAFKDLNEKGKIDIARNFYKHIVKNVIEFLSLAEMEKSDLIELVNIENSSILKEQYEKGKGVIIITGHLGNWELLAARLVAEGYPLTVIAKDQEDRYLNDILISIREKMGMINIPKKLGTYKTILNVLKKGEVIGLLADQNGGKTGIFVNFFGVPASTFKGPAYFAFRSGSPAIPVFCFRTDRNTHIIKVLPPIEVEKKENKNDFILDFTKKYTLIIEDEIRKHPEQWLWFHDRWKTKPMTNTVR